MNIHLLLTGGLLLLLISGCGTTPTETPSSQEPSSQSSSETVDNEGESVSEQRESTKSASSPEATATSSEGDAANDAASTDENSEENQEAASSPGTEVAKSNTTDASPSLDRDYEFEVPIPETGTVTARNHIDSLDLSELISDCPPDSAPYAFAESTNFFVQICSEEFDPWLPKYYIGQDKGGGEPLKITSSNLDEAKQLVFKNGDYTYLLYRDGARPTSLNAYLEVYTPDGGGFAEALLRIYERPQP